MENKNLLARNAYQGMVWAQLMAYSQSHIELHTVLRLLSGGSFIAQFLIKKVCKRGHHWR